MAKKAIPFVDPETGIQIKPGIYVNKILPMTYLRSQLNIKISTVKFYGTLQTSKEIIRCRLDNF